MKQQRFWRWTFPAIGWALVILALTSYPKMVLPDIGFRPIDKVAHLGVYFILGFLVLRAYSRYDRQAFSATFLKSTIYCTLFAAFDEIHQLWIPGRSADFNDFLADFAGILIALASFRLLISAGKGKTELH